ncbi:MAG: 5'-3' exonuclease H3TH domain-containing protein [Sandaracinus sp.]|jgi:5'-3' exonuclease
MQVHLVDGTYELFRSFYGAPSSRTSDGREVGAVRALARSLWTLRADATHVAVAFDTVIESFRNDRFAGYKTGDGIDPALSAQFPLAERAADALGLVVWRMVSVEADDALATFAARAARHAEVERVLLCSPDKDLAQCVVGSRVIGWDRRKKLALDDAGVREKFGVAPASIPDFLALVGDTADGIPGVPRWGEKSAAAVLAKFGELESIPARADAWGLSVRGADALAASLAAHRDEAFLYRELATLRRDAPLAERVEDLLWLGPREELLRALVRDLEDDSLLARVSGTPAR